MLQIIKVIIFQMFYQFCDSGATKGREPLMETQFDPLHERPSDDFTMSETSEVMQFL